MGPSEKLESTMALDDRVQAGVTITGAFLRREGPPIDADITLCPRRPPECDHRRAAAAAVPAPAVAFVVVRAPIVFKQPLYDPATRLGPLRPADRAPTRAGSTNGNVALRVGATRVALSVVRLWSHLPRVHPSVDLQHRIRIRCLSCGGEEAP